MAREDGSGQISLRQERAMDVLLRGGRDSEAAEAAGVRRQTVNKWRHHDAAFIAALNRRRRAIWQANLDRLRALVGDALDTLVEIMGGDDPALRLRAAQAVLDATKPPYSALKPCGATEARDVELQWEVKESVSELAAGLHELAKVR